MHIIEEMVLFRDSQPVQNIELDAIKVKYFSYSFLSLKPISSIKGVIGSIRN